MIYRAKYSKIKIHKYYIQVPCLLVCTKYVRVLMLHLLCLTILVCMSMYSSSYTKYQDDATHGALLQARQSSEEG